MNHKDAARKKAIEGVMTYHSSNEDTECKNRCWQRVGRIKELASMARIENKSKKEAIEDGYFCNGYGLVSV